MENQNNINYKNSSSGNQFNNITTIHNEINVNKNNPTSPDVQAKACPSWIPWVITSISVIADILSIVDMILHNSIKSLFHLAFQNTKETYIRIYLPLMIIIASVFVFAILYNLLCKKHFYRIIRNGNKLYFLSGVKCPNCEETTFTKLKYNLDTEQYTFTCQNCRHRFTYNFSELYKTIK